MERRADLSRRDFLRARAVPDESAGPAVVRPPWLDEEALSGCTGCGACVDACPQGIVRLSAKRPVVEFSGGECTLCGACARACPERVFDLDRRPFPHVVAVTDACLAFAGVTCRSCGDACPVAAIRFRPRIGGPFLPEPDPGACTGCGACVAACPHDAVSLRQVEEGADA